MRKLIVTLLSEAAWICVALLVGPLFPLGDWRWGALVFGFLAILLFMYRYEVAHLSAVVLDRIRIAVTRNSATDEPAWEKVYTARSAADLFEAVNTRTSANAAKYIQPHIGKWIKIQNTEHRTQLKISARMNTIFMCILENGLTRPPIFSLKKTLGIKNRNGG